MKKFLMCCVPNFLLQLICLLFLISCTSGTQNNLQPGLIGNKNIQNTAESKIKYIAVGEKNIWASSNALSWESISFESIKNITFRGIAYGNGRFVTLGTDFTKPSRPGGFAYSNDGKNWQYQTFESGYSFSTIVYGNGRFIVGGSTNNENLALMGVSTDGVNWKFYTLDMGDSNIYCFMTLTYGGGLFEAFAAEYTATDIKDATLFSKDGESWYFPNQSSYSSTESYFRDSAYNENLNGFITVGDSPSIVGTFGNLAESWYYYKPAQSRIFLSGITSFNKQFYIAGTNVGNGRHPVGKIYSLDNPTSEYSSWSDKVVYSESVSGGEFDGIRSNDTSIIASGSINEFPHNIQSFILFSNDGKHWTRVYTSPLIINSIIAIN